MLTTKEMVDGLRKVAQELREQAQEATNTQQEKCAHVLIAAHGLNRLQEIIQNPGG